MRSTVTAQQPQVGTCPACKGTKVYAGDPCRNCGAQYQFGSGPAGVVLLNYDGEPCWHAYAPTTVGRCQTKYVCKHCPDEYLIDSGD